MQEVLASFRILIISNNPSLFDNFGSYRQGSGWIVSYLRILLVGLLESSGAVLTVFLAILLVSLTGYGMNTID